jgi:cupin fold WbuC family metalloprotein
MKLTRVDRERLARASKAARASPRLRMNDNLHGMQDAIHRLLNATEPGTYVQPHRHASPPKTETLCVIAGRGAILTFGDDGELRERVILAPGADCLVVEIPPSTWHTLVALEPGTVWFEVKAGPYEPLPPADIAAWAPAPGSTSVPEYLERLSALSSSDTDTDCASG